MAFDRFAASVRRYHARMPEQDRPQLSVVLPVFNEQERIGSALEVLFGWLAKEGSGVSRRGRWEVLAVDDGSDDLTLSILRDWQTRGHHVPLRVLPREHMGKGAAVTAGVLAAKGESVLFMDADMATPPSQIPVLLEALRDHDVALGSRIQPDGADYRASQPLHRRIPGEAYRRLAGLLATGDVPDTQCGFKGFRRGAAQAIFPQLQISGLAFDAEIIYVARRLGYEVAVVPIYWQNARGSRVRLTAAAAAFIDLARVPFVHRHLYAGEVAQDRND